MSTPIVVARDPMSEARPSASSRSKPVASRIHPYPLAMSPASGAITRAPSGEAAEPARPTLHTEMTM